MVGKSSKRDFLKGAAVLGAVTAILLLGSLAGTGTFPKSAVAAEKVTFLTDYVPYEGTEIFVWWAKEKGYYQKMGLEVDIKPGAEAASPLRQLAAGIVDFFISSPTALVAARHKGVPVVSVAVIFQENQNTYVSLAKNNIKTLKDFMDRSVATALGDDEEFILRLMLNKNLSPEEAKRVKIVPGVVGLGPDLAIMTAGKADVIATWKVISFIMKKMGQELNEVHASDYGVKVPSAVISTTDRIVKERPQMVAKFLQALMRGMKDQMDPARLEEIATYAQKYQARPTTVDFLKEYIGLTHKLFQTPDTEKNGLGWQTEEAWAQTQQLLLDNKIIKKKLPIRNFFNNSFLKKIYQEGKLIWPS